MIESNAANANIAQKIEEVVELRTSDPNYWHDSRGDFPVIKSQVEYKTVVSKISELDLKLNKLAREGWRICDVVARNSDIMNVVVFMKREKV